MLPWNSLSIFMLQMLPLPFDCNDPLAFLLASTTWEQTVSVLLMLKLRVYCFYKYQQLLLWRHVVKVKLMANLRQVKVFCPADTSSVSIETDLRQMSLINAIHVFSIGWHCHTAVVRTPSQMSRVQELMTLTMSASGERCCQGRRFPLSLKPERNSATGKALDSHSQHLWI